MPDKNESGFLSRWSQRKRNIESENVKSAPEDDASETKVKTADENFEAEIVTEVQAEPTEEELEMQANLEAAEAVDLEALEYESDFEVFLKKGVPDALKNAAMQKLWRSNPVLAVLDGLNDYDEDFGDAKLNVYKSAWHVGRGFLTDEEMNHNPVDRVKAVLEKLVVDDASSKETLESEEVAEVETALSEQIEMDPSSQEISEQEVSDDAGIYSTDVQTEIPQEDVEPKRVSLRSRLFEHIEDEA